jgi:hypothetical protein
MTDDKTKHGPADAKRINVDEAYEVQYWTKEFGISAQQLRAAVKRVGVMVEDVRAELRRKH